MFCLDPGRDREDTREEGRDTFPGPGEAGVDCREFLRISVSIWTHWLEIPSRIPSNPSSESPCRPCCLTTAWPVWSSW